VAMAIWVYNMFGEQETCGAVIVAMVSYCCSRLIHTHIPIVGYSFQSNCRQSINVVTVAILDVHWLVLPCESEWANSTSNMRTPEQSYIGRYYSITGDTSTFATNIVIFNLYAVPEIDGR
jgi:hypothetical protein